VPVCAIEPSRTEQEQASERGVQKVPNASMISANRHNVRFIEWNPARPALSYELL
jgi:hypothetical protein